MNSHFFSVCKSDKCTVDTKIHEFTSSNLNFVHYDFPRKPSAQLQNKSWKYFLLLTALVLGALLGQTQPKHIRFFPVPIFGLLHQIVPCFSSYFFRCFSAPVRAYPTSQHFSSVFEPRTCISSDLRTVNDFF